MTMSRSEIFKKWGIFHKSYDAAGLLNDFANHIEYSRSKDQFTATLQDLYFSLALTARDRLVEQWIKTQQVYHQKSVKRVYYLSAEYLMGRALVNNLINLDIYGSTCEAMDKIDIDIERLIDQEPDAGLGNGGLGPTVYHRNARLRTGSRASTGSSSADSSSGSCEPAR